MKKEERDEILNRRLPDEEVAKRISEPSQPTVLPTIDLGKNGGVGEPVTVEFIKAIGYKHVVGDMYKAGSIMIHLDSTWWFCIDYENEDRANWRPVKDIRHLVDIYYDIDIKPYL